MRIPGSGPGGDHLVDVGVWHDRSGGWRRVLDQERIAHREVTGGDARVVVVDGALPDWSESWVADGGVLVVTGALPDDGLLGPGRSVSITGFVPPGRTVRCVAPCLATVFERAGVLGTRRPEGSGELRVHEDRLPKFGTDPGRHPVVVVRSHGRGAVVATGVPLAALLTASGDRLRRFASFSAVTERVAAVDKAEIADTMLAMLRRALGLAGLPLVTVGRFPGGARSVLILRVDVDGVFGERAMDICRAAAREEVALSVYVNGELSERHPGALGPWPEGVEVGQHAWTHTLFDSVEENVENLRRARDWMTGTLGRSPGSFVAPRGMWNPALAEALRLLGHAYSSDFGLDFDSLPFRSDAGILQVPVHPYSPERATVWASEEGLPAPTAAEVRDHFLAAMEAQVARGRPAHLYGHPEVLGRMADDVLPAVVGRARALGLPDTTVGGYAAFWSRREAVTPRVVHDPERGTLDVRVEDGADASVEVTAPGPLDLVVNGTRRGRISGERSIALTVR